MTTDAPTTDDLAILVLGCAGWMNREQGRAIAFLDAQLRELLAALPRIPRLDREAKRRLAELAERIDRARLEACARIVSVDTLRRWYRELIARKWTHPHRGPGRPPIAAGTAALIVRLARENPLMGTPGIVQRLALLGYHISRATVRRVLAAHGIDPAPLRTRDETWAEFLDAHADQIAAIDFTTIECFDHGRLVTQYGLFAIHHDTRRVAFLGLTDHPDRDWMAQQARNLTADGGLLADRRFLLMDRDAIFSERFRGSSPAAESKASAHRRSPRTATRSSSASSVPSRKSASTASFPSRSTGCATRSRSSSTTITPSGRTRVSVER